MEYNLPDNLKLKKNEHRALKSFYIAIAEGIASFFGGAICGFIFYELLKWTLIK